MYRFGIAFLLLFLVLAAPSHAVDGVWDDGFASYHPLLTPGDVQEWDGRLYITTGSYSDDILSTADLAVWDGREWSWLEGMLDGLRPPDEYGHRPHSSQWRLDLWDDALLVAATSRGRGSDAVDLTRVSTWDGTAWTVLGDALPGFLRALAVAGDTPHVLVSVAGPDYTSHEQLLRWDGAQWERLDLECDLQSVMWSDGEAIHVVGTLRTPDDAEQTGVLRFDGSAWSTVASVPSARVDCLARWKGRLLAGLATFAADDDVLLQWDGAAWIPFDVALRHAKEPGFFSYARLSSIRVEEDRLVVTGSFRPEDDLENWLHVAAFDGTGWSELGGVVDGYAHGLTTWRGIDTVYGGFSTANGRRVHGLALRREAGWEEIRRSDALRADPHRLLSRDDGLWVTGNVYDAGGVPMRAPVVWDGATWSTRSPQNSGAVVYDVAEHEGKLYAAGSFRTTIGDSTFHVPLAVREDDAWTPIHADWGEMDDADNLVSWGSSIAVSSRIWPSDGPWFGRVAIWDDDVVDTLDTGDRGEIHALTTYKGRLYVAGLFYELNDTRLLMIAAYDGTTLDRIGGVGGEAHAFEKMGDELVVGGHFLVVGDSINARAAAVWNDTRWKPLGEGFTADRRRDFGPRIAIVRDLAWHDGALHATGWFDRSGDVAVNNLARWDGAAWQPVGGGVGDPQWSTNEGRALASHDGDLYVSGEFFVAGDVTTYGFARWRPFAAAAVRRGLGLDSIAPNPMNPTTRVHFTLTRPGPVRVDLYDARGRHVACVLDRTLDPGEHDAVWDGTDTEGRAVASGVYFVRVRSSSADEVGKVALVR